MKKAEAARLNIEKNLRLFICPICRSEFSLSAGSLKCQKGHCFDISSNGSLNLCYPPKKQDFKYSAERMKSRRAVIEHGFFDALLNELSKLIDGFKNPVLLDCGCGEGSMIKLLAREKQFTGIAADISKDAIALAASGAFSGIIWLAADSALLPLADESVDIVLSILAPSNYAEFKRVLKPGGILIKAIPGAGHLRELRERLFSFTEYDNSETISLFVESLGNCHKITASSSAAVTNDMLRQVFEMTPMTENSDLNKLIGIERVSSDFMILVYKNNKVGSEEYE